MATKPAPPDATAQLALPLARGAHSSVVVVEAERSLPPGDGAPSTEATASPRPKTKRLADALQTHLGPGAELVLTDNRTTLLSHSVKRERIIARVHQMFLDGGDGLFDDIARYMSTGDAAAGARIDTFVHERDHLLMHHAPPLKDDAGRGAVHNLDALFAAVNARYFQNAVDADITWGHKKTRRGRRPQRSITFGTYDVRAHRITIHPVLDDLSVPEVCVARVVHHEMLHTVFPDERSRSGRRLMHGPLFKRAEALFDDAVRIDAWFDEHLAHLLKSASRSPSRAGRRATRQK